MTAGSSSSSASASTPAPPPACPPPTARTRAERERVLLELTSLPTAAGREQRVLRWIRAWTDERDWIRWSEDRWGNVRLQMQGAGAPSAEAAPLVLQAHLDHPAFVLDGVRDDGTLDLAFRGGVRDPYFTNATIRFRLDDRDGVPGDDGPTATIRSTEPGDPFRRCTATLDGGADPSSIPVGTIATWDFAPTEIDGDDIVHAPAIDDLAGVAAALSAFDETHALAREAGEPAPALELLLTRAEEIGLAGTVGAAEDRTLPAEASVVTLETSRSFADSPIGDGPIVRVGDRISTFDPIFTGRVAEAATRLGKADEARAQDDASAGDLAGRPFRWQRKLMAGGACEATVWHRWGWSATCVCLPLGNYHNMGELDRVEAESPDAAPVGREYVHREDHHDLVRLLVACARDLPPQAEVEDRLRERFAKTKFVLE